MLILEKNRGTKYYLSFRNSNWRIKHRPDDVFVTVSGSQRAVVSEEAVSMVRKKIRQRDRISQWIAIGCARIDDIIKLFKVAERNVISLLQLIIKPTNEKGPWIYYKGKSLFKKYYLTSWINYHSHKFRIPQSESQIQPIHPREVEHR